MSKLDELFGERIKENKQSAIVVGEKTEAEIEIGKIDKVLTFGLLLLVLIVPLVIRVHFTDFISPQVTGTTLDTGSKADIFTFYKLVFLLIGTSLLTIVFLYKVFFVGYKISKSKINIFTGILAATIIVSAIFAPNKTLALFGTYNRNEGTLTYLCYIALFFIASNIKYSNKQMRWFIYILYPFVIINTVLGLLNFFGIDILKYDFGKSILFSGLPEGASLTERSKLIATINHGNYVSGFAAVLLGLFLTWALLDKSKLRSAVNLFFSLLAFAMLLGSLSSSGFVTIVVMLPIIAILIMKSSNKKHFITMALVFLIASSGIFTVMANHNPKVWDESVGMIIKENPFKKSKAAFEWKGFMPDIAYANDKIEYTFPELPKSGVGAGSGRVYIWGKTWELIKERPLLGYGLDTLTYHFPQNDTGIHTNIANYKVTVDKPHNMYVGMAYGSGLIALLAFVLLFSAILLRGIIDVFKANRPIVTSILIACMAFMIQGLFNDTISGTAVVFIVLLGILSSQVHKSKEKY